MKLRFLTILVFTCLAAFATPSGYDDDLLNNQLAYLTGTVTAFDEPGGPTKEDGAIFILQRVDCKECFLGVKTDLDGKYEIFVPEGTYRVVMRYGTVHGHTVDQIRDGQVREVKVERPHTTFNFDVYSPRREEFQKRVPKPF